MKGRRKILVIVGIFLLIAIAIVPVQPKYGGRPFMSHWQWEQNPDEISNLLSAYDDTERDSDTRMIQVNVDQLTRSNGYSILRGEGLFGRRSVSAIGYLPEQDASQFYRDEGAIWIGVEDISELRKITKGS